MAALIIPSLRVSLAQAPQALARTTRVQPREPEPGRSLAERPSLDRASDRLVSNENARSDAIPGLASLEA